MGGRKHRLSVRKYQEKKKPLSLIVTIKLTKEISVLTLSLPRELYMRCPVHGLPALTARLESQSLPPQWFLSSAGASLSLFKIHHQEGHTEVRYSIQISEHLQWSINICGKNLTPVSTPVLGQISSVLSGIPSVMELLGLLDSCRPCLGNNEQRFLDVVRHRESTQQGNQCFI